MSSFPNYCVLVASNTTSEYCYLYGGYVMRALKQVGIFLKTFINIFALRVRCKMENALEIQVAQHVKV